MGLKMFGKNQAPQKKAPVVIAIAAGKGGVGKSAVTANLAHALHRLGYHVGVIDADVYGPSLRLMLPEDRMPEQIGLGIKPATSYGIELISMGHFRQDAQATVVRAPIANGLISQFLNQVQWGPLDFLLIDFPPGTGDIQITLSQRARLNSALLVTTPQQVAVLDVKKCLRMFEQVEVPILGIVENMSYFTESNGNRVHPLGKGGGRLLAEQSGNAFLSEIPLHPLIGKALDEGRNLFEIQGAEAESLQERFLTLARDVASSTAQLQEDEKKALGSFELAWQGGP